MKVYATIWQWRYRYRHYYLPNDGYKTIGDGRRPDYWWMQMEYREIPTPGLVWC